MPDRKNETAQGSGEGAEDQARKHQGGYEGGGPEYGRGYGRDFGGGLGQGFDGSHGEGYGGSLAPSDYRERSGGDDAGGGMSAGDYDRSQGGRGQDIGADARSWLDRCADDESQGRKHHRGRGPKDWSRDDQRLYEEVCERLLHDRLIDARGIEVEVENGVVTLRGEARAASDPMLAEQLVREVPGVKGLQVSLALHPRPREAPQPPSDDERIDKSPRGYPILPT